MRFVTLAFLVALAWVAAAPAVENPKTPGKPEVRELGKGMYQVGSIVIDKAGHQFTVPGKILRLDPPIEFLAVTKGGYKAYESFLELQADAIEFNLACILIGLEENKGKPPKFHFDPEPLQGTPVEILLSWEAGGKTVELAVTDLFKPADKGEVAANDWVYTGSYFTPDGRYSAEVAGTLVGLIHDPDSIIEHRKGFGQASYGNLKPDSKLLPPLQTPVRMIVRRKG